MLLASRIDASDSWADSAGLSAEQPTTACAGTPARAHRAAISNTALPSSVVESMRPSPVTTAPVLRSRSSKPMAARTHAPPAAIVAS
jgi:hypothetical protein